MMTPVKIENVSTTEHHTVRLTPANGEVVDPTTLVGAALWSDDLSICLSPPLKDDSCYGTTEAMFISRSPMTPEQTLLTIDDTSYGYLLDDNTDIIKYEILEDSTLVITNNTDACIRISLGAEIENGIIDATSFGFAEDKPEPYFEFDQTGFDNVVHIHLAPSRLGKVAIDPTFMIDGSVSTAPIFGDRTVDLVLQTSSLLPASGLNFEVDGQSYHLAFGQKQLTIPITIPKNVTRYPQAIVPELWIDEPEYLLGGSLPSISPITVKPEGFNYGIYIRFKGPYNDLVRQASSTDASVSFYDTTNSEKHLQGGDIEYELTLDPSFAGAELRCWPDYAINPLLGTVNELGVCKFKTPYHWTLRKDQDLGLRLYDVGNPEAFFSIHGLYAYGTEPGIQSDTLGDLKTVTGRLSTGFGNKLTLFNIPRDILEIIISNDPYGHAGNAATPFAAPKRVTRASPDVSFEVVPDKPTMLYNSSAGAMLYYLNYIQIQYVIDGVPSKKGQWYEYRLNVVG